MELAQAELFRYLGSTGWESTILVQCLNYAIVSAFCVHRARKLTVRDNNTRGDYGIRRKIFSGQ
jgi:hypothetical protein